jgi:phosphatidate cytidylyltransferase
MLKYRLITGPLLIVAFLAIVWFDNWLDTVRIGGLWSDVFRGKEHLPRGLALFTLCLLVLPLAANELSAIFKAQGILTRRRLTTSAAIMGLVLSYSIPWDTPAIHAIAMVTTGMVVMFVWSLFMFSRHQNVNGIVAAAGAVLFAMVYLGFMLGFLLAIRRTHSAWWIVGIIFTIKAADTGAYFTGRAIGRHKLIPWLSPGKTWEGTIGGVMAAMLAGYGLAAASHWLPATADHVSKPWGLVIGGVFAIVGQFGDLTMSLCKRGAGLKDSSRLLPGLGGVLDVLDSPLLVAPVAYWMLCGLPVGAAN